MPDFLSLASQVEAASGPDRELDCWIWLLVGEQLGSFDCAHKNRLPMAPSTIVMGRWMGSALEKYPNDIEGIARGWRVPTFTASLDAALSLVPEGWHLHDLSEGRFMTRSPAFCAQLEVWVTEEIDGETVHATPKRQHAVAATLALAIASAALKARAQEGEG